MLLVKSSYIFIRKHKIDKWKKDMNKQLSQEEIANKLLEKWSISLVNKEILGLVENYFKYLWEFTF